MAGGEGLGHKVAAAEAVGANDKDFFFAHVRKAGLRLLRNSDGVSDDLPIKFYSITQHEDFTTASYALVCENINSISGSEGLGLVSRDSCPCRVNGFALDFRITKSVYKRDKI